MTLDTLIFDPSPCGFPKPRVPLLPTGFDGITLSSVEPWAPAAHFRHFARGRYALRKTGTDHGFMPRKPDAASHTAGSHLHPKTRRWRDGNLTTCLPSATISSLHNFTIKGDMTAALKKPRSPSVTSKRKPSEKTVHVVSEVDLLIARLKKLRKGQSVSLDVRQAIEDGRA